MSETPSILDQWGTPFPATPPQQDVTVRTIRDSINDRASLGSLLTSVKPSTIRSIFAEADAGLVGRQIELAQDIEERDGHLRTQLMLRALAVAGMKFEVKAGSDSESSEEAASDARAWWNKLKRHLIIRRLMKAVHQQYAIERVIWDRKMDRWTPIGTEQVDARRLTFPQSDQLASQGPAAGGWPSPVTPGLSRQFGQTSDLEPLTPGQYIVSAVDVERSRPGKGAMCRVTAVLFMLKHFAIIDWGGLVEKFGMPWTIVKYVPGMGDDELKDLLDKLAKARAERLLAVPSTASVETTTGTSHTSSPPQEKFIAYIEDVQSKVVLGNTTQTDPAGGGAENVSSPTHQRGTTAVRDCDAVDRAEELSDWLFKPWFAWNRSAYGADAEAPILVPVLEEDAATTLEFKRKVYLAYQSDGTAADMLLNATNLKDLTRDVQLPVNEEYEEPYIPVRDRTNAMVSGEVIRDADNDIVGGDVIEGSAPQMPSPFGQGAAGNEPRGFSPRGLAEGENPAPGEEKDAPEDGKHEDAKSTKDTEELKQDVQQG